MTDDALSFLRDGQNREAITTIDLASGLQTVCDQFPDLGYDVTYDGSAHLTAPARPDDLQRAVTNLVDNATRYGTHTVVRLAAEPMEFQIEVEDDGPGILESPKEALPEAFVRGEPARTMDDRAGYGLGLSIAQAHSGQFTLHDRMPHCLIARITLPVDAQQADTALAAKVA
jgi:signal transduction histidine kinase